MMKVKICGLTNLADALAAIEAGADMLGFNFYDKSPRYIPPETARAIAARVRASDAHVKLVGVFVNADLDQVQATLQQVGLDLAQLHGDEPVVAVAQLKRRGFKALRPASMAEGETDAAWYAPYGPEEPALLIDAYRKDRYGGTGQIGDWSIAARVAQSYPILLAGGLTPDSVAAAIEQVKPWGVDVASGVESAPGHKDIRRLRAFIEKAKAHERVYHD
jgi:phosphoribosylanthranilate isomerase